MSELDLLALDRAVRDSELGRGALPERALHVSHEAFAELRAQATKDPLARALEPWLLRQLEHTELATERAAVEHAYRTERHVVERPEHARLSLAELFASALSDRARRGEYLHSYLQCSSELSATSLRLWTARAELAAELGVELDSYELALPSSAELALAWLERSRDAYAELAVRNVEHLVTLGLAENAAHGWPAHLSLRSLSELVADGLWFDGLEPRVRSLPQAYGAASFLRGLALLGRTLAQAVASTRTPFSLAADASGLKRHTQAALFVLLTLQPSFLKRKLDLGPQRLAETARALAICLLIESRAAALRVLLRAPLLAGGSRLLADFPELYERAFGFELPRTAALTFGRVHRDDAQRFAGLLCAAERTQRLIERHDDDWYRNPRAVGELRQELEEPQPMPAAEVLALGAQRLHEQLAAWI